MKRHIRFLTAAAAAALIAAPAAAQIIKPNPTTISPSAVQAARGLDTPQMVLAADASIFGKLKGMAERDGERMMAIEIMFGDKPANMETFFIPAIGVTEVNGQYILPYSYDELMDKLEAQQKG